MVLKLTNEYFELCKNSFSLRVGRWKAEVECVRNLPPRLIPTLLLLIQPLNFIFYRILPALNITMTADFLFLPKATHLFIYLLLKPMSSKLQTSPSANKKIRVQLKDCTLMTLSHWSFSSQSRLGFFL